jgi:hypothetical protein
MRLPVGVAVALPVLLLAAPAGAAGAPLEQTLSVAVSDGVAEVEAGDRMTYVVVVENSGGDDFSGSVNLRFPGFLDVVADNASITEETATWEVDVQPGETVELQAEATFARPAGDEYQVVAVADVADSEGSVIVRAADADDIPGATAPADVPGLTDETAAAPSWVLPVTAGALVSVIAAVLAATLWVRTRRRRSHAG